MKGNGRQQKKVFAALALGPMDRPTLESRTGVSGNKMDQAIFGMVHGGLITRTGKHGRYIYTDPKVTLVVPWTTPVPVALTPAIEAALTAAATTTVESTALDSAIMGVALKLSNQIAEELIASISAALPAAVTRAAEKFDISQFLPKPAASGPPRMKVAVVGLRTKDTGFIAAEFATKFDLSFAETDQYNDKTKAMVRGAGRTFIMTDHINHSMVEYIKAQGATWELVAGGQTTLRAKLDALPA